VVAVEGEAGAVRLDDVELPDVRSRAVGKYGTFTGSVIACAE